MWKVASVFWLERSPALPFLGAVLVLQVLRGRFAAESATSLRGVLEGLQGGRSGPPWAALRRRMGMLTVSAVLGVGLESLKRKLRLAWARALTERLLASYMPLAVARLAEAGSAAPFGLSSRNYVEANADAILAEDVDKFVDLSLRLLLETVQAMIHLYFFGRLLWRSSATLAKSTVNIAVFGTIATLIVGRRLPLLYRVERDAANDFRYVLTRARENAESIAFYDGTQQEVDIIDERHLMKQNHIWRRKAMQDSIETFSSLYRQLFGLAPFVMLAEGVTVENFEDEHVGKGHSHHSHGSDHGHSHEGLGHAHASQLASSTDSGGFASIIEASEAFDEIVFHLMMLAENMNDFSRLKTIMEHLEDYMVLAEGLQLRGMSRGRDIVREINVDEHQNWFSVSSYTVKFPERTLIEKLSISLRHRESLLIAGESGVGKSTFFKEIQGLTNHGKGEIQRPGKDIIMFIPQNPYLTIGTLRDQLFYPTPKRQIPTHLDDEIRNLLRKVRLQHLESRLGEFARWSEILSVGEQQRVAFCRVALNSPRFVFIDEGTSALDEELEREMYRLVESVCFAWVSIGHRRSIERFHSQKLTLFSGGSWNLQKLVK